MDGANFFSGLLQGLNSSMQANTLAEEKKALMELQKESAKLQMQKTKHDLQKQQTVDKLLQHLMQFDVGPQSVMPSSGGETGTTPLGDSFPKPPSDQPQTPWQDPSRPALLDLLSDPKQLMAFKLAGIDLTDIAKFAADRNKAKVEIIGGKGFKFDERGNLVGEVSGLPVKHEGVVNYDPNTGIGTRQFIDPFNPPKEPIIADVPKPIMQEVVTPQGKFSIPRNPFTGDVRSDPGTGRVQGQMQIGPPELDRIVRETPGGAQVTETVPKFAPFKVQTGLPFSEKPKTSTEAGREALAGQVLNNYTDFEKLVLDKKGNVDKTNVFNMSLPLGGMPFSEGRTANSMWTRMVEAPARFNTGAQMSPTEKTSFEIQYKPSPLDTETLVKNKLAALKQYATGIWQRMNPGERPPSGSISVSVGGVPYAILPNAGGTTGETIDQRIERLRKTGK